MARRPSTFLLTAVLCVLLTGISATAKDRDGEALLDTQFKWFSTYPEFMQKLKSQLEVSPQKITTCATYGLDKYRYDGVYRILHTYLLKPFKEIHAQQDLIFVPQIQTTETYATDETLSFLNQLSTIAKNKFGAPLHVTALTQSDRHADEDSHCGHRSGLSFDLRPLPGDQPTTYFENVGDRYKPEQNKALLAILLSNKKVSRVIFNDPALLKDASLLAIIAKRSHTQWPVRFDSMNGHDNHLHVELYPNPNLDALTKKLIATQATQDLSQQTHTYIENRPAKSHNASWTQ